MKQGIFAIAGGVIFLLIAVACASTPAEPVPLEDQLAQLGFTIGQPVKRIINYPVSGWNSLDRKHVIMNFGAARNYLLTLRTSCDDVLSASLISFSTTVGNLTDNDKLLVRNSSNYLSQCYISTIHELEKIKKTHSGQ